MSTRTAEIEALIADVEQAVNVLVADSVGGRRAADTDETVAALTSAVVAALLHGLKSGKILVSWSGKQVGH